MANATTTAMGTIAAGAANSSGTNASWVATVKPNGVSKRTLVASTMTTVHQITGASAKPCGGLNHHRPATAATKPAPTIPSASSSRLVMPEPARRRVSASNCCSSKLGSNGIALEYRPEGA